MARTPEQILQESSTIAVVGASRSVDKSAGSIPASLQFHGWTVIPVNPHVDELLGVKAYPRLTDIPGPVDLVNVFRPSADAPEVARQAVAIGAKALWLQLGIASPEARRIAEAAGLDYVEDRCIAVVRAINQLDKRSSAA